MEQLNTIAKRINPQQFYDSSDLWEFVKLGLLTVKARIGNRSDWQPLHIRKSIEAGASELWVVYDGEKPVAFYILSLVNDPFSGIPKTLWIWICFNRSGETYLLERHIKDIKARAKVLGVETIEMMSPRRGWTRRAEALGFSIKEVIYGMDVV